MINDIQSLLVQQLKNVFGVEVHDEHIQQNLIEPYFLVLLTKIDSIRKLNRRIKETAFFNVIYYPRNKTEPRKECITIQSKLRKEFKYLANQYQIKAVESNFRDDSLSILIQIDYYMLEVNEEEKMKELGVIVHE
ncbi:DUF6838 family protein [Psychrobacillus sp.]|uniref:phage tail terminator family protein n=1 Tax=Psychrobacillus sp. TaxID=1871623 RepID=UPI0028BDF980|nr:hypothetical protein [Psychrobacillus sp.]